MLSLASLMFAGCENPDKVRANPVMLQIDGTFYSTNPDEPYRWGPGGQEENTPDARVQQYSDYFIFSVADDLYDEKQNVCSLDVDFIGQGQPQLGVRYELAPPESDEYGIFRTYICYMGEKYPISAGWVEFSEYGVNADRTRAYVSGLFSISVEGDIIRITDGKFGRMLECSYKVVEE